MEFHIDVTTARRSGAASDFDLRIHRYSRIKVRASLCENRRSPMKDGSKYDLVVKDLFQRDHPSLLDKLTGGVAVSEVLSVELARVEQRRADLVLLLADGTLLHLEFQSSNDKDMPYRMGIYCLLLGQKYRRRVRQVLL